MNSEDVIILVATILSNEFHQHIFVTFNILFDTIICYFLIWKLDKYY